LPIAVALAWAAAAHAQQPVVHIREFGAKCDGTTDDTAAIQSAVAAASGKRLGFVEGATCVISTVDVPANTVIDLTGTTVKQKPLGAGAGSPMFNVTGGGVTFTGGVLDGHKAAHAADGFCDCYHIAGATGIGRAYRAAIDANAVINPAITDLTVRGVSFRDTYGAAVATLDVPLVRIEDNSARGTNFELAFLYHSGATRGDDAIVTGNVVESAGSGHASVNANGVTVSGYRRALLSSNRGYDIERTLIKVEGPSGDIRVENNRLETNTANNFACLQLAAGVTRALIRGNRCFDVGSGIAITGTGAGHITIEANAVYTTKGREVPDCFRVDEAAELVIAGNRCHDSKRHGVYVTGAAYSRIVVRSNVLYGQRANSGGLVLEPGVATWNTALIEDNLVKNFATSIGGHAPLEIITAGHGSIRQILIAGNIFDGGGFANYGLRSTGTDALRAGTITNNYIDGQLEHYSAGVQTQGNTVTGNVTIPRRY
jgi:hypothetical protein